MSEKIDLDEITMDELVQLQKNYIGIIHHDDRARVFNLCKELSGRTTPLTSNIRCRSHNPDIKVLVTDSSTASSCLVCDLRICLDGTNTEVRCRSVVVESRSSRSVRGGSLA